MGDVIARNAAGVERTHGQLRAGLADGLSRNNADSRTDIDRTSGGKVPAVALLAYAMLSMAGHNRANDDLFDASSLKSLEVFHGGQVFALFEIARVSNEAATDQVLVQLALFVVQRIRNALVRAAIDLANDNVLCNVDKTTGQITRVCRTQRGVGHALTRAVRGDEVLQNGKALAEVGLNRTVDSTTLRVTHQTTHTRKLTNLLDVTSSAGERHHIDGVELVEVLGHGVTDLVGRLVPDVDNLLMTLLGAHETHLVVFVDRSDLLISSSKQLGLVRRHRCVEDGYGDACARCVVEAGIFQAVQDGRHLGEAVAVAAVFDQAADFLLIHLVIDERMIIRKHRVERDAADAGLDALACLVVLEHAVRGRDLSVLGQANENLGLQVQIGASVVGVERVVEVDEHAAFAREAVAHGREVIQTDNHVLRRNGQRATMSRALDVVGRQHEHARLGLGLIAQRHMHSHLVAVEVSVKRGADQRMQLDGLAFDKHRLECLDAQTMQGWCAVEQNGMVDDDLFQNIPHVARTAVDGALCGFDIRGVFKLDQALHDEGFEQLQGHLLRQTALMQLQVRADDDNRTAGIVDALAEQVLAETALLALEHVRERLQRTIARTSDRTAATAVVEQGVHSLLEHALLVVHDDFGSTKVEQSLQAVIAVDDATVQVVEVGGRETTAVELDHRTKIRRNDRDNVENHVGRTVVRLQERVDDLQTLDGLGALLALARFDGLFELFGHFLQVHGIKQVAHGLCAHAALEVVAVVEAHLAIQRLIGNELLRNDLQERIESLGAKRLTLAELLVDIGDFLVDLLGAHALVFVDFVDELVVLGNIFG